MVQIWCASPGKVCTEPSGIPLVHMAKYLAISKSLWLTASAMSIILYKIIFCYWLTKDVLLDTWSILYNPEIQNFHQ